MKLPLLKGGINAARLRGYGTLPVFGVGYAGLPINSRSPGSRRGLRSEALNITTLFKDTAECRGHVRQRSCMLYQGTVEYAVQMTNDSIVLKPLPLPGAKENSSSVWQQDRFIAETRKQSTGTARGWSTVFRTLFPPIEVHLVYHELKYMAFSKFVDCGITHHGQEIPASDTTCRMQASVLRDLSVQYFDGKDKADESANRSFQDMCPMSWRDPMPVCHQSLLLSHFFLALPLSMSSL